jgi:hypothetical protein
MLTPYGMHINKVEVIDWKVGAGFKQVVSKGLRFRVSLPILDSEDLDNMHKSTRTNGWIVRLTRRGSLRAKAIGRMYIPLVGGRTGGRRPIFSSGNQQEEAHFEVFYAAASPSKRFENFICPAFGHNLVIKEVDIIKLKEVSSKITPSSTMNRKVRGKCQKFSFRPALFNGGPKLAGRYKVEIAAYDYNKKVRRSSYVEFPEEVKVYKEVRKPIRGCSGFKIPKRKNRGGTGEFKFSR